MTEEINNLNTDLKELFVNSQFDEIQDALNNTEDSIVLEITLFNYDVIKKYYDAQKFSLLFQFIKFVAYSSFLCDYAVKRQLINSSEYEAMSGIFADIYAKIKESQN